MPSLPESPQPPKELVELQTWFAQAVVAQNKSAKSFKPDHYLNSSKRLKAAERLEIYMGDYWPRVLESLAEDFPMLKSFWGDSHFDDFMRDYLKAFPSTSFTLFHLGSQLQKYIDDFYTEKNKNLVLDIVRLEWARMHAYMAKDGLVFDSSKLSPEEARHLSEASLRFHPSVTLLHLEHPLLKHTLGHS
ncbi:hypothetical protein DID80_07970, partial [Candidatus Marinamargulisbacteria bacterium SCGC AAA071-K20]